MKSHGKLFLFTQWQHSNIQFSVRFPPIAAFRSRLLKLFLFWLLIIVLCFVFSLISQFLKLAVGCLSSFERKYFFCTVELAGMKLNLNCEFSRSSHALIFHHFFCVFVLLEWIHILKTLEAFSHPHFSFHSTN